MGALQNGEAALETWPNKAAGPRGKAKHETFVSSISRGDPQKWDGSLGTADHEFERLEKLRQTIYRNLPQGEQPSITDVYALAGKTAVCSFCRSKILSS